MAKKYSCPNCGAQISIYAFNCWACGKTMVEPL